MKRRCASFVLATLLALSAVAPASAVDDETATSPEESVPSGSPVLDAVMSFSLGPPQDRSIGDWREIGRASMDWSVYPRHLSVVGERLVASGRSRGTKVARSREVGWHSVDGMTWTAATIPGDDPKISDMTATPDGSMAIMVGYHSEWSERGSEGAVWTTRDGMEWTQAQAPPVREVDWVAASDDAVVVLGEYRLWVSEDLEAWQQVEGPGGTGIAFGPGGFLASGGGGQDSVSPTELWQSPDGFTWTKVKLPKALRKGPDAFGAIDVVALDDGWLLVPDEAKLPKSIFTSPDGRDWRRAPRPRGMTIGYLSWVDDIGDGVQAFGWAPGLRKPSSAMWTWQPGRKAVKPVPWRHDRIGQPVLWDGQRIALGEPAKGWGVTLWRWKPPAGERVEVPEAGIAVTFPAD